ncbi:MAG: ArnT family glycosyltransferase, partial [Methanosarcinales archaeon]
MEGVEEKKEITLEIKHPEIFLLLGFLGIVFFFELQVTLNSPIVFGDEGFHTTLAKWISTEKEYPVWEPTYGTLTSRGGFHQKPLWNILEGSFYLIFGFNDIIVKILTPFIASILLGVCIFVLVKKIYNEKIGLIASIIAVTLPTLTTYAVLVYTDALFTFYFSLFILTFILAFKTEKIKYWVL